MKKCERFIYLIELFVFMHVLPDFSAFCFFKYYIGNKNGFPKERCYTTTTINDWISILHV